MRIVFLLFIQLVWASSYTLQKMALVEMPLGLVLIFRYGFASLFFLLSGFLTFREKFSLKEWGLILLVGVINFSGSPFFQLKALTLTYALDASILISFEPLVMTLLAIFFLKEKLTPMTLRAFLFATLGAVLMATSSGEAGSFQWGRLLGDLIFLCSLVCEGINSITSKHLIQKHHPLRLTAWLIFVGFSANLIGNFRLLTSENLQAISVFGWSSVLYLALFCSCIGYGVWGYLLKKLPVNQVALSLFLQPILGTLLAVLILKERLNFQTAFGGLLILFTLLFWFKKTGQNFISGPSEAKPEYQPGDAPSSP